MRRRRSKTGVQLVSMLVAETSEPFTLMVEPEGMSYEFPGEEKVLLTFRGTGAAKFELSYSPGCVSIWRPGDTEVWAATLRDQTPRQIGGWAHVPAPGLDSAAPKMDMTFAEWDHLPLPSPEG